MNYEFSLTLVKLKNMSLERVSENKKKCEIGTLYSLSNRVVVAHSRFELFVLESATTDDLYGGIDPVFGVCPARCVLDGKGH